MHLEGEETDSSQEVIEVAEDKKVNAPRKLRSKKDGLFADNFNILYNITCGHPKRIYSAILFTALANFINMIPFGLTIAVVQTVFESFDGSGTSLNTKKIWIISGILIVFIFVMYVAQVPAYNHCYNEAYKSSVSGRMELAEHIRRLPLGTIYSKDPGEMVSLLMNDFLLIETCSSHVLPQLFGALVMPVVAFIMKYYFIL